MCMEPTKVIEAIAVCMRCAQNPSARGLLKAVKALAKELDGVTLTGVNYDALAHSFL
jgi:hypothetical protein